MNVHFRDAILAALKPNERYSHNLRESVESLYRVGQTLDAYREKFAGDKNLSESGRRAALGEIVRKELARNFATASRSIRSTRAAIKVRRADFDVPPIDKSDLVGELRRREV